MSSDLESESWGQRVFAWRDAAGLTQPAFIKLLRIESATPSLISNWETGKNEPSRQYAQRVFEVTGIRFDKAAEAARRRELANRVSDLTRRISVIEQLLGIDPEPPHHATATASGAGGDSAIADAARAIPARKRERRPRERNPESHRSGQPSPDE